MPIDTAHLIILIVVILNLFLTLGLWLRGGWGRP